MEKMCNYKYVNAISFPELSSNMIVYFLLVYTLVLSGILPRDKLQKLPDVYKTDINKIAIATL